MKSIVSIFIFMCLSLLISHNYQNNGIENDNSLKNKLFFNNLLFNKLQKISNNTFIIYKKVNDSNFVIQWGDSNKLRTLPYTFSIDGHETWIPKLISNNDKYLVLRKGCGNPCWVGYFLPKKENRPPIQVNEYLGYNLECDLVASVVNTGIDNGFLKIQNLRTGAVEFHKVKNCKSSFLGYCIKNLSMKNGLLKYHFYKNTIINSKKFIKITEKIKI